MCKIDGIGFSLGLIHAYLATAIGLIAAAIIANGSFWGAVTGQAATFMMLVAGTFLAAVTTLLWVRSEVLSYLTCMRLSAGSGFPKCLENGDTFERLYKLLLVFLGSAGISAAMLAISSVIPWVVIPAMIVLSISVVSALVNLVGGLDLAIAQLIECVKREAELAKKQSDLMVADLDVLTCPMNKATCGDNDLRLAGQFASGTYSTTPSFAVVLKARSQAINAVAADVTDSFGNTSSSLGILQPNQHTIHDPSAWVVRGDWSQLGNDIRVEGLPRNMWTVNVEMKLANGKTANHAVSLMINN